MTDSNKVAYRWADFALWMAEVDAILARKHLLTSEDLPDCCYRDWQEDGLTPAQAATRAVRSAEQ
jgi:hypothetical protein